MKIGDLSKLTQTQVETIRYYEKVGLLPGPPRSSNGYRVYSPELVQRLQFILRARDLGYAMDEIRSLLSLTDTGAQTCAEVMARTELHLEDVRRRIADLQKIEVTLATTLARCTGDDVAESHPGSTPVFTPSRQLTPSLRDLIL